MYTTLIEPAELRERNADPDWAIIDCRFDLARPRWGREAYASGHIPGALYAHLDEDLSGPITPASGRHPLPDVESLATTLGTWGVDGSVQVVAYDQGNGAYASRLWWLLRWLGHSAVAVLNGGFAGWQEAHFPLSTQATVRTPRRFAPRLSHSAVVTTSDVARWVANGDLSRGDTILVDARTADRFAGRNETVDPVAGHIPGAVNRPFVSNVDGAGRFLPAAALRVSWAGTLAARSGADLVAMCGSGVTACHDLLPLEIAGITGGRLYAGSWSEWIRDAGRPVEPPRGSTRVAR
jgi:thiosulfate/3-mercaptopyruvate sulfurtransferase